MRAHSVHVGQVYLHCFLRNLEGPLTNHLLFQTYKTF